MKSSIEMFSYIQKILAATVVLGIGPVAAQVLDVMQGEQLTKWKLQWLFADGASGIIFLIGLSMMMYIVAPSMDTALHAFTALGAEEPDPRDDDTLEEQGLK